MRFAIGINTFNMWKCEARQSGNLCAAGEAEEDLCKYIYILTNTFWIVDKYLQCEARQSGNWWKGQGRLTRLGHAPSANPLHIGLDCPNLRQMHISCHFLLWWCFWPTSSTYLYSLMNLVKFCHVYLVGWQKTYGQWIKLCFGRAFRVAWFNWWPPMAMSPRARHDPSKVMTFMTGALPR